MHIEQCTVLCRIGGGRLRPLQFGLGEMVCGVAKIHAAWQSRDGQAEVRHFALTGMDQREYELTFHGGRLVWEVRYLE